MISSTSLAKGSSMIPKIHDVDQLPAYHDNLIIVKIRPTAAPLAAAVPEGGMTAMESAPGLSALAYFERAGMVRRVMPLHRRAMATPALGPSPAIRALVVAGAPEVPSGVNAGVSLVELEPGTNLQQLQTSLAGDQNVAFVSRVPIRYLMAKKRTATRTRKPPRPHKKPPRTQPGGAGAAPAAGRHALEPQEDSLARGP
jgi:hypothetical protein